MGELVALGVNAVSKLVTLMAEHPKETTLLVTSALAGAAGYGMGYKDGRNDEARNNCVGNYNFA